MENTLKREFNDWLSGSLLCFSEPKIGVPAKENPVEDLEQKNIVVNECNCKLSCVCVVCVSYVCVTEYVYKSAIIKKIKAMQLYLSIFLKCTISRFCNAR